MSTRQEVDSMGTIEVNTDRYWGAQTQRSLQNFEIGDIKMKRPLIRGFGILKHAAAQVNAELGLLAPAKAELIQAAAKEVIAGDLAGIAAPAGGCPRLRIEVRGHLGCVRGGLDW